MAFAAVWMTGEAWSQVGDCCEPASAAGCSDPECASSVCVDDPFCCQFLWDGICADAALMQCDVCSDVISPPNDACTDALAIDFGATAFSTHGATTDGEPVLTCESSPCLGDFSLYRDVWFSYVAADDGNIRISTCGDGRFDAKVVVYQGCGSCPAPGAMLDCGDVCLAGTGGEVVISASSGDCILIRIGSAAALTGEGMLIIDEPKPGCPSDEPCCLAHSAPGCEDFICCATVCSFDPFCCDVSWDSICVTEAGHSCVVCGAIDCLCAFVRGGPCCMAHRGTGCDDFGCCQAVCDWDEFCCFVEWDQQCVIGARHYCGPLCPPPIPGDIAPPGGDGVVNAADLADLLAQWGRCPAKGTCAADIAPPPDGDGIVDAADLAELLANWT